MLSTTTTLTALALLSSLLQGATAAPTPQDSSADPTSSGSTTPSNNQANPNLPASYCAFSNGTSVYHITIGINGKTTPETGSLGQGLLNNVNGECGTDPSAHSTSPGTWDQSGTVTSYTLLMDMPISTIADCVSAAIKDAEEQNVQCIVQQN